MVASKSFTGEGDFPSKKNFKTGIKNYLLCIVQIVFWFALVLIQLCGNKKQFGYTFGYTILLVRVLCKHPPLDCRHNKTPA